MSEFKRMNHPRQKFLFFVAQDITDSIQDKIIQLIKNITSSRSWIIGPPRIVSSIDKMEATQDSPIETLGGELEIYSAAHPLTLPKDIDRQHLEEVEAIVEAVRVLSEHDQLAFEFELDGVYVGAIDDGIINKTLRVGLLDEWEKGLQN